MIGLVKAGAAGVAGLVMAIAVTACVFDKTVGFCPKVNAADARSSYEPKPIPCGPDVQTVWRYRQEKGMPFFRKQIVDPFKASGEADKPWAAAVIHALEEQCSEIFEERLIKQDAAWKQADVWVKQGCAYPVIRWMQAMGFSKGNKKTQALDALKTLDVDLAGASSPWFARMLVGIGRQTVDPTPENERMYAARVAEWLENGGVTSADSRHVRWLIEQLGTSSYPALIQAFEKSPKVDPWLTLILRGRVARRAAWDARGSGFAASVTKDGWRGFEQGVREAKAAYEEAWRLHPEFPEAAALMVDICGSMCDGGMREWFDRAVALEMDQLWPYSSYAWYSRPRWGGSVEMMKDFAEDCYATRRHDTMVPKFYATIMFQTIEDLKCSPKEVFGRPDIHAKSVEVLDAQVRNAKAFKNIREMCGELLPVVEYLGGDWRKAVEYNRRRNGVTNKSSWTYLRDDFYQIYDVLNGLVGPNSNALFAAEELYQAGRYPDALTAFANLRSKAKLSGLETDYVVHRMDGVRLATAFPQGEWVVATFNDRFSGWLNFNRKWRKDGDGVRTDREKCPLEWMNSFPEDVEYEGVFRSVAPVGQDSKVCFQLDKYGDNVAGWPAILFEFAAGSCRVATGGRYDVPDSEWVAVDCEKAEARFRIVSRGNKVSVWVNGQLLVDGRDMTRYMRSFRMDGTRRLLLYGTRVVLVNLRMRSSAAVSVTGVSKSAVPIRVVQTAAANKGAPFLVIDLSAGEEAKKYPVSYLSAAPAGGWDKTHKTDRLVLKRVEPGTFIMGSPASELGHREDERQRQVTLTRAYYIGIFEVTQRQWELVMGSNPSWFKKDAAMRPVEQISYCMVRGSSAGMNWPLDNAVDETSFVGRLRSRTGLSGFDLPTEAQWEYACRAETETAINSGKNLTSCDACQNVQEVAVCRRSRDLSEELVGPEQGGSATVGSRLPNRWGLYDMHGNVLEWCLDCFGPYSDSAVDPVGAKSGSTRVLRGGPWWYYDAKCAANCRSARRYDKNPRDGGKQYGWGFRISMTEL